MKTFLRWPVLLILAAFIVAALVPTILTGNHTSKAHASGGATLSLSAPIGQPGTTIQATGQGFTSSSTITLYLGSTSGPLMATAISDTSGNLPSTNITVPDQPGGYYGIVASQGSVMATAQFTIEPSISLSKTLLYPNASIIVTVKGFGAFDFVYLYLDNTNYYYFSSFGVNQNGDASITTHFQKQGVLQGSHTIIAKNAGGLNPLTAEIAITVKPVIFSTAVKSGMNMQLNGAGFTANEPVSVYWGNAQGQLEGTTITDAYGNLSFPFTVPSSLSSGSYLITVLRTNQSPHIISSLFNIITPVFTSTPGIRNGQNIKVKIAGFLPNEQVTISWDANGGQTIAWLYTDQKGAVINIFAPPSAPTGSYTLTAVGSTSGLQATASRNVSPGILGGGGNPGSTITITGGGFTANETVNVYFQTPKNGIVVATTDATGYFNANLAIPSTYNPAIHYYLHAVSINGIDHAEARFLFSTPTFYVCGYSCSEIYYGQGINLTGSGFAIGETVNIIWNYQQPDQFTIASTQTPYGNFSLTEIAPSIPNHGSISIAAIGQSSHIIVTTDMLNDAAIYDNPANGKVGTSITVKGGDFGAGDTITLSLQGSTIATTTSNTDGTFTTTFKVPQISGSGNLTLTANDLTTNTSATVPFQYVPVLNVHPTIVQNGDTITVSGKHFSANAIVSLSWDNNPFYSTPSTNANGSFTTTIQVSGLSSGTYSIVANDGPSGLFVSVPVIVQ